MSLGFQKNYSWRYPILKLKDLRIEIKYAWQRAFRGYDDRFCYNLNYTIDELIEKALIWFRYNRHGSPQIPNTNEKTCHKEWDKVLDEILYNLKESDDERCSEKNEFNDSVDGYIWEEIEDDMYNLIDKTVPELREKWRERESEIVNYKYEHRKKAYTIMLEYMGAFWD